MPGIPKGRTWQVSVCVTVPSMVWPLRSTVIASAPIASPGAGQLVRSLASFTLWVSVCPQWTVVSGDLAMAGPAKSVSAPPRATAAAVALDCINMIEAPSGWHCGRPRRR